MARAIAAKSGFCRSTPVSMKPEAFISSATKPSTPLLKITTFTGSFICVSVIKSPISMANPPSADIGGEDRVFRRLLAQQTRQILRVDRFLAGRAAGEFIEPGAGLFVVGHAV